MPREKEVTRRPWNANDVQGRRRRISILKKQLTVCSTRVMQLAA
jgi:hypothetical protein